MLKRRNFLTAFQAALALVLFSHAIPQSWAAILYQNFEGTTKATSSVLAIEGAVIAAERSAYLYGYGACEVSIGRATQSIFFPNDWSGYAVVRCSKDTTPPPPPSCPTMINPVLNPIERLNEAGRHKVTWQDKSYGRTYLSQYFNGVAVSKEPVYKGSALEWTSPLVMKPGVYTYKLSAYSECGGERKDATVAPQSITVSAKPATPSAPSAPAVSYSTYRVSWASLPEVDQYYLFQSRNGSDWDLGFMGSATSAEFTNLPGGVYQYRIQACANGTCSDLSPRTSVQVIEDSSMFRILILD